jgi:hypothetical protein
VYATGGLELVSPHLSEQVSKRKPVGIGEAGSEVLLGAASKRNADAPADVADALLGERLENGIEGGLLHDSKER